MSPPPVDRRPVLLCIECMGVEIYLHASWLPSLTIFGLAACWVMQRWSVAVALSTVLAMAVLIAMHEFGHALAARCLGAQKICVVLTGRLWVCVAVLQGSRADTRLGRAIYCAAGWLAQLLVGAACLSLLSVPQQRGLMDPVSAGVAFAWLPLNAVLLLGSVVPLRGSDGAALIRCLRGLPPERPDFSQVKI